MPAFLEANLLPATVWQIPHSRHQLHCPHLVDLEAESLVGRLVWALGSLGCADLKPVNLRHHTENIPQFWTAERSKYVPNHLFFEILGSLKVQNPQLVEET